MMEKREKVSNPLLLVFIIVSLFTLLQFFSPFFQPSGSITDLSGMTLIIDNEQYWSNIEHPWQDIYRFGDVICHTKSSRSFFLNQNQLPLCARCTAIWIGLSIGLFISVYYLIKNHMIFFFIFVGSIGLLGVDGVGQLLGLWESTNLLRLITGLLVGIFTGLAIGLINDEINGIEKKKSE